MKSIVRCIGMNKKRKGEETVQGGEIGQGEEMDRNLQREEEDQKQRLGKQEIEMDRYLQEIVSSALKQGTRDINVKDLRGNLRGNFKGVAANVEK